MHTARSAEYYKTLRALQPYDMQNLESWEAKDAIVALNKLIAEARAVDLKDALILQISKLSRTGENGFIMDPTRAMLTINNIIGRVRRMH